MRGEQNFPTLSGQGCSFKENGACYLAEDAEFFLFVFVLVEEISEILLAKTSSISAKLQN